MEPPVFPKLDPAEAAFWDVRYRERFTPWDAGAVPAELRAFVEKNPAPGRVLVPGCGHAHDVRFLSESGWEVDGIDFSPEAVEAAKPVLGPFANRVRLADFFGVLVSGSYGGLYERAFLCALPRSLWPAYAQRVATLVKSGGILAGYFFIDPAQPKGPPFALRDQEELDALLSPNFTREYDVPASSSIPVFAGRERCQIWRRK